MVNHEGRSSADHYTADVLRASGWYCFETRITTSGWSSTSAADSSWLTDDQICAINRTTWLEKTFGRLSINLIHPSWTVIQTGHLDEYQEAADLTLMEPQVLCDSAGPGLRRHEYCQLAAIKMEADLNFKINGRRSQNKTGWRYPRCPHGHIDSTCPSSISHSKRCSSSKQWTRRSIRSVLGRLMLRGD